jgi:dTDP-4-amino-4,6-dideoxygalactose transaminase
MINLMKKPAILGNKPIFKYSFPITLPTTPPWNSLKNKYKDIISSGMLTNSKLVCEFESKIANYLGVKYAVAVSSCTCGLMLVLKVLNLKGEVILPSFTFHATAHSLIWNNLKPIFVDCDLGTFNIDPIEVKKAITSNTCAILAVHIFGNPADVDSLSNIAKKNKLKLIFDAAHGLGSEHNGMHVGTFGDAEVFSLSPTKLLTCGEGGLVATNNKDIADKVRIARNYGDSGNYNCEFSGFNSRMGEFSALLGLEGLKMLDTNVSKRNKIFNLYKRLLINIPGITFQKILPFNKSSFKDISILIEENKFGLNRDVIAKALLAENISVKKYFYPAVHKQKTFLSFVENNRKLVNTNIVSHGSLSLPVYSHINMLDVEKICLAIQRIYFYRDKLRLRNPLI